MKVKVEIDTLDIFNHTTYNQDDLIVQEIIDKAYDETIKNEVKKRALERDLFDELPTERQRMIIEEYADEFGYTKKEE
jgi:hypothetical protein